MSNQPQATDTSPDKTTFEFNFFFGDSTHQCANALAEANSEMLLHNKITTGYGAAVHFLCEVREIEIYPCSEVHWLQDISERLDEEFLLGLTADPDRLWRMWLLSKIDVLERVSEGNTQNFDKTEAQKFLTAWFNLVTEHRESKQKR